MEFFFGVFDNDEFRKLDFLKEEETRITKTCEDKKEELKAKDKVGRFDYFIKYNLGVAAFKDYLKDKVNTATIFHFSGHHGHSESQLADALVNDAELITLLNNSESLKLVFLNGCETEKVIKNLDQIPMVIGTKEPINDHIAMEISASFYELLLQDLDNLLDSDKILKRFEQAIASENLIKKGIDRGEGGWTETAAKEKGNSYISKINKTIPNFNDRMLYGIDLESYPVDDKYQEEINSWIINNQIKERIEYEGMYDLAFRYFPKPLSHFLQKIEPQEKKEKYLKLGESRFEAIQGLYFTLLTFLKCCAFSYVWDCLLVDSTNFNGAKIAFNKLDEELKNELRAELGKNWYEEKTVVVLQDQVRFLKKIFEIIVAIFPKREFSSECLHFLSLQDKKEEDKKEEPTLLDYCQIFNEKSDLSEQIRFLKAESFLKFFLDHCSFLLEYELVSVHDSKYYKYKITDDEYHYTLRFFPKGGEYIKEIDGPVKPKLYDVYSMVLVEKTQEIKETPKPILNLSPFYVDENILDGSANIINLACLARYSYRTEKLLYFNLDNESMTRPTSLLHNNSNNQAQIFTKTKINDHIKEFIKLIK